MNYKPTFGGTTCGHLDYYIATYGWPNGLSRYSSKSPELAYRVSTELSQGHAAWKGFLSYRHRTAALVIEKSCGTVALSISRDFEAVDSFIYDASVRKAAVARFANVGASNVRVLHVFAPTPRSYD